MDMNDELKVGTLADYEPIDFSKDGVTLHLEASWCAYLDKAYPHLFIKEAVLHLIDEDMQRKRATR